MTSMHYTSNAFNVRIDRARSSVEFAQRRSNIVASVAKEVASFQDGQLRERGGLTDMVTAAIGNAPDTASNDLGIATNPDYWVWQALRYETDKMRTEIQTKVIEGTF